MTRGQVQGIEGRAGGLAFPIWKIMLYLIPPTDLLFYPVGVG